MERLFGKHPDPSDRYKLKILKRFDLDWKRGRAIEAGNIKTPYF
jgi:hypothetical protein